MEKENIIEEEKPSKWTFGKYLKGIAKYKWWVIGSTVLGTVLGFVGFKFVLNPIRKNLTAQYSYNLAGTYEDEDTIRFVDGTVFNSYDLTNIENLKKVKDSKEEYSRIDVEKIITDGGITVTKDIIEKDTSTTTVKDKTTENVSITYTLVAKARCFPNDKVGKEFLYDLITLPKSLSNAAISNYHVGSYFSPVFETLSFETQVEQLGKQYDANIEVYTALSEKFSTSAAVDGNGTKLYQALNAFQSKYYSAGSQVFYKELESSLAANKYVKYNADDIDQAIADIKAAANSNIESVDRLKDQIATYESILTQWTNIKTYITDESILHEKIIELSDKIAALKTELFNVVKELNKFGYECDSDGKWDYKSALKGSRYYLEQIKADPTSEESVAFANGCKAFTKRIADYHDVLEDDSEVTTSVLRYCYDSYQNRVSILGTGYVVTAKGISDFIGLAAGLVLGFAISSLICASIYINKEEEK